MAYLFEFISNLFQYVYSIDFIYFMFSGIEYALLFLAWIFIIVPTMLYATQSYKPKDFLGYITAALLWCVCGFLVVLSPFSLLLYFIYRWLYEKASALRRNTQAKKQTQGKLVKQCSQPESPIRPERSPSYKEDAHQLASHFSKTKATGNSSEYSKQSPAHEVCRLIWQEVDMYIKYVDQSIDRKQHMYLWAAYFYVVVKTVRDKNFINDVYSHFNKFAIRYIKDSNRRAFVVQEMRADYREIRPLLNASGIAPNDVSGRDQLWALISAQMYKYGDVPTNADRQFKLGAIVLSKYSLRYYRNSLPVALVERYSLDTSSSEDSLPDA